MRWTVLFVLFVTLACQYVDEIEEGEPYFEIYPSPTYLRVISIDRTTLKLEWSPLGEEFAPTFFQVERSAGDSGFVVLKDRITTNFFYDYSVESNKQYEYRVKAYNQTNESDYCYVKVKYDRFHKLRTKIEFPSAWKLKSCRSGKYFAASNQNLLTVWNSSTLETVVSLKPEGEFIGDFNFSILGEQLIYAIDSIIVGIHLPDGEELFRFPVAHKVDVFAVDQNLSRFIVLTYRFTKHNVLHDLILYQKDGTILWQKNNTGIIYDVLFVQNDQKIICTKYGGISILDVQNGTPLKTMDYGIDIFHAAKLSYDQTALFALRGTIGSKKFFILNLETNTITEHYLPEKFDNSIVTFCQKANSDTLILGNANYIQFLTIGAERPFYSFAATLEQISRLVYLPQTGEFVCQAPEDAIYVYSSQKVYQWRAY